MQAVRTPELEEPGVEGVLRLRQEGEGDTALHNKVSTRFAKHWLAQGEGARDAVGARWHVDQPN